MNSLLPWQKTLAERARHAMLQAYAPYSRFRVGAALMLDDGNIVEGCNVENCSYGLTICAERTAAVTAIARGERWPLRQKVVFLRVVHAANFWPSSPLI